MPSVTEPIRQEHRELLPHIEQLLVTANQVGVARTEEVRAAVADSHRFLTQHLLPHAEAEDRVLYPAVARAMGAPEATHTMSRDHVEVARLTADLGRLHAALLERASDETLRELRRVLYGLYALVRLHFAKEEEIYLPLLDARMPADEAAEMLEAMEHAAHEAKARMAA